VIILIDGIPEFLRLPMYKYRSLASIILTCLGLARRLCRAFAPSGPLSRLIGQTGVLHEMFSWHCWGRFKPHEQIGGWTWAGEEEVRAKPRFYVNSPPRDFRRSARLLDRHRF
jgi:hypothetical protein